MQPSLNPHIQAFIDYIKFEKRFSKHTILSYHTDLAAFFDYLLLTYGAVALPEISHLYIRSWLATLKDDKNSAKTINRKISSLRSFFKYQLKIGVVSYNPMVKIVAPKNEKRLPNFVADKDMATLLQHVEFQPDWMGKTERLLLLLFYQTGVRLSEVINLQEHQVNFANNTVKVIGKGNKERIIPVNAELLSEIQSYVDSKNAFFENPNHSYLLVTDKGKQLYPKMVYIIVKKYLSLVTTIENEVPMCCVIPLPRTLPIMALI